MLLLHAKIVNYSQCQTISNKKASIIRIQAKVGMTGSKSNFLIEDLKRLEKYFEQFNFYSCTDLLTDLFFDGHMSLRQYPAQTILTSQAYRHPTELLDLNVPNYYQ